MSTPQDKRADKKPVEDGPRPAVPVLGAAWAFPIQASGSTAFDWATDDASVSQSIEIILSTSRGERAMRPDFGCNLRSLVFAPNNGTTRAAAAFEVQEALRIWEPRIEVLNVEVRVGETPSLLIIEVAYRVRSTDNRFNL